MSGIFGISLMKNEFGGSRCARILMQMRKALPDHTAVNDNRWIGGDSRIGLGSIHAIKIEHPTHFAHDIKNKWFLSRLVVESLIDFQRKVA